MVGLLVHALHWSMVALGVAGSGYLLLPQLRLRALLGRRAYRPPRSVPEHEDRVLLLREAVASGRLTAGPASRVPPAPLPPAGGRRSDLRAVVAISSLSAGVVHAAVFPHHLRAQVVVGPFFATAAVAQVAFAVLATRSAGNRLLYAGVVGNAFLVWLWVVSRTAGLPAGLADGHTGVGPWDLAAKAWELSVVAGCLLLLRRPPGERLTMLTSVGRHAWLWAALSTGTLLIITLFVPHQ